MQTLYLVLHEKQTCSDLQGSVIMVILLQMNFNKCKRRQSGSDLHDWPADRTTKATV